MRAEPVVNAEPGEDSAVRVLLVALRLGLTSFGGPVAHLGYFRREYVDRRGWLDESTFADLVALTQVLPGPSSSQLGIAIGTLRAGYVGGLAAWVGFTLPSAIAMVALAIATTDAGLADAGWVAGLKLAAVAVVAQAVIVMARTLTPDVSRRVIAGISAFAILLVPLAAMQVLVILVGAAVGLWFLGGAAPISLTSLRTTIATRTGAILLTTFVVLLGGLSIARRLVDDHVLAVIDAYYRAGALVFGGGHVVLPLLSESVVGPGWVGEDRFLAGYSAAQAVPGPMFSFAGFLGAAAADAPNGVTGGVLALIAIFLSSFLLVWGALPWWDRLRGSVAFAATSRGTNAAVVGILAAALVTPVASSALSGPLEVAIAAVGLVALLSGRIPPIAVVAGSAVAGQLLRLG